MTTIYLVRHGEATGNRNKTFQGITDNPLTPLGIAQGKATSQRFAEVNYDLIYTSPLCRAVETAKLINIKDKPIIIERDFIEVSGGELEDKPFAEVQKLFPEAMDIWNNQPHKFVGVGAEDLGVAGAEARVKSAISRIVKEHKDKTIIISTHGYILRIFNNWITGNCLEDINKLGWGDNTCITCAEFDSGLVPTPIFINDASHLSSELSTKDFW